MKKSEFFPEKLSGFNTENGTAEGCIWKFFLGRLFGPRAGGAIHDHLVKVSGCPRKLIDPIQLISCIRTIFSLDIHWYLVKFNLVYDKYWNMYLLVKISNYIVITEITKWHSPPPKIYHFSCSSYLIWPVVKTLSALNCTLHLQQLLESAHVYIWPQWHNNIIAHIIIIILCVSIIVAVLNGTVFESF